MLPALIGLTAAAAASAAGYQSMAPTGQWYGRTFAHGMRGSKQIALTYDDGPNDPHTLKLLDVLAKHSVRATFFMIGRYVQQRPDIARAVAQAGTRHRQSHVHPSAAHFSNRQAQNAAELGGLPVRPCRTQSASIRICFVPRLEGDVRPRSASRANSDSSR
jgi:peptidoglycan/xylan/chitin deacetylase (PgdA/CDA1 family)